MSHKTANFGGSVDIASRQTGATDALQDLGMASPRPQLKELDKNRLGGKVQKAPEAKSIKAHKFITSGALENPKVAFLKMAAEEDAPNYGRASSNVTNCANCKAYQEQDEVMGYCVKYDFYANSGYTCDAWTTRKGRAPSQFVRTKAR